MLGRIVMTAPMMTATAPINAARIVAFAPLDIGSDMWLQARSIGRHVLTAKWT
jgi:hypothetical protein